MAGKTVLRIDVSREGNRYRAYLVANAPDEPEWKRGVIVADTPVAAVKRVLTEIDRIAFRPGPGRKPRGYRVARHLANGK